eukprot:scaffold14.g1174.t1
MAAAVSKQPDLLDNTVAFLKKRDGVDKAGGGCRQRSLAPRSAACSEIQTANTCMSAAQTLKIIRYTTKVLLATSLEGSRSEAATRLRRFEKSVGTSRKAFKLGKFLQAVNALRKTPLRAPYGALAWAASTGEAAYYFLEQIQVRVGAIWLGALRINAILERELALLGELRRRQKVGGVRGALCRCRGPPPVLPTLAALGGSSPEEERALRAEIALLRSRRALRTLGLLQDLADSLLALADLREGGGRGGLLGHKGALAAAGLLSGALSFYKNWPGVDR